MTFPPSYPRRGLLAALRDLLTRRPSRPEPTTPDPDDWGDDPTGAWSPEPPTDRSST
ncbi:hypothetical protein [Kitasatospora sp. MBT66]|uniref:hypothetical protein n=1 Tax=Kitasatospora sp. MBT66 TaxID=1444769 RepID=UPI000AD56BF6|nr:hypothetical protein [Kitasatospora sp. MBT66]